MDILKNKLLASRLRELRNAKGLSQTYVAQTIGASIALYHRIENGERGIQGCYIEELAKTPMADSKKLRALCLAKKIEAESNKYSKEEIETVFNALNNK